MCGWCTAAGDRTRTKLTRPTATAVKHKPSDLTTRCTKHRAADGASVFGYFCTASVCCQRHIQPSRGAVLLFFAKTAAQPCSHRKSVHSSTAAAIQRQSCYNLSPLRQQSPCMYAWMVCSSKRSNYDNINTPNATAVFKHTPLDLTPGIRNKQQQKQYCRVAHTRTSTYSSNVFRLFDLRRPQDMKSTILRVGLVCSIIPHHVLSCLSAVTRTRTIVTY